MTSKERILDALQGLPDDASFEQAIDRLYLLHKIEVGLRQVEEGDVTADEDFKIDESDH